MKKLTERRYRAAMAFIRTLARTMHVHQCDYGNVYQNTFEDTVRRIKLYRVKDGRCYSSEDGLVEQFCAIVRKMPCVDRVEYRRSKSAEMRRTEGKPVLCWVEHYKHIYVYFKNTFD